MEAGLRRFIFVQRLCLNYLRRSQVQVFDIAIVLVAFLGAAHILIRTSNYGPELDIDTWKYISVAESLAAGDGVKDYLQRAQINAPPLYPISLALFGLLGINPIDAGRFVNIVSFGLIILLTGYYLNRQVKFRFLAVVGSVAIMTSYPLSEFSTFLLTDTLYILFALLALFQIQLFVKSEDPPPSLLALSTLFTGLAISTRYAGISVLLTSIILIFLKPNFPILRRLKCAVIYGTLSIIPFGIWMTRNWLSGSFLRYDNYESSRLLDYLEIFSKLFVSNILVLSPDLDWFIYLICTAGILILCRESMRHASWRQISSNTDGPNHLLSIFLFNIFAIITILVLIFMAPNLGTADQLGERQLLPVYVPVIIVVCLLLDILLRRLLLRWKLLEFTLVCLISTGVLGSISLSSRWNIDITVQALKINAEPQIFERLSYPNSMELWTYLRDNPLDGQIYSNGYHLLYWFTDVSVEGAIGRDSGAGHCSEWVKRLAISPEPTYIIYFTIEGTNLSTHKTEIDTKYAYNSCNIQELPLNSEQRYLENIKETSEVLPSIPSFTTQILNENTLQYTKNECTYADLEPYFYLHIIPVDVNTLPNHRTQLGFDNLDFHFHDYGTILNNKCTATIKLPHYSISRIRTGQKTKSGNKLWGQELSLNSEQRYLENIKETSEAIIYKVLPSIPSFTTQILNENTLQYTKNECTYADLEPYFYLHIIPVDVNTLPNHRTQLGFDNLDFHFHDYGTILNNKCTATIKLPHYSISRIRTGQKTKSGNLLWGTELSIR